MNTDTFWLNNPTILMKQKYITEIIPKKDYSIERKLNAISRVIFLCLVASFILANNNLKKFCLLSLVLIIVYYILNKNKSNKASLKNVKDLKDLKEGFTNPDLYKNTKTQFTTPQTSNPLMNITMNEYTDNPLRKKAAPSYNVAVKNEIEESVKNSLDPRLFQDLGDNIYFEQSMRQFYTTPNTTLPNSQKDFAEFCYGGMTSRKDGEYIQH